MTGSIKKVAVINDITGVGRCGLAVAIPILSAMGYQACPLPTAVLSAHPGFGDGYRFHELEDIIEPYLTHWNETGVRFDCFFSGYIPSPRQFAAAGDYLKTVRDGGKVPLVVIDPVMGDNGRLYKIFSGETVEAMRAYAINADVITPNLTEACLLAGSGYDDSEKNRYDIDRLLDRLCQRYGAAVVKGVRMSGGSMANAAIDDNGGVSMYTYTPYNVSYPGTGDIFAALLTGRLLAGDSLHRASAFASERSTFLTGETLKLNTPPREGLALERFLTETVSASDEPHKFQTDIERRR